MRKSLCTNFFLVTISLFYLCTENVFCQDSSYTRTKLKGLSFGINFNPVSIGNSSLAGKYWVNEQFVALAGLGFNTSNDVTTYRTSGSPTVSSYNSNISLLVGAEYHIAKQEPLSAFARFSLSYYTSTVPGWNNSQLFDSGVISFYPGFGVEYFITTRVSVSLLQTLYINYAWGNGLQPTGNPSVLADGRSFQVRSALTFFLLNIYF